MAVSMTPVAASRVKELMTEQKLDEAFLRMGVRGGGCSGMTYDLQFDNELRKHDKQFEVDGVKVVVDVKSYLYLNGTTLDFVTQGLTGGFTFVNPNAKSSCGCARCRRSTSSQKKAWISGRSTGKLNSGALGARRQG